MKKILLNALLFQIAWLVCVQANNLFALTFTACYLVFHAVFFIYRPSEWWFIFGLAAFGYFVDSLFQLAGLVRFNAAAELFPGFPAPLWLACLWLAFATTVNHSLAWLRGYPALAFLIGFFIVPLTYWAGVKISDSEVAAPVLRFYLAEAILWSLLLPVALHITTHTLDLKKRWAQLE